MLNENGIDFLKWFRKEEILLDVILIIVDKSMERIRDVFRYGVVDYLIKLFIFERFKEFLNIFKERFNGLEYYEIFE